MSFDARATTLPMAVSAFANELYRAARSWAGQAYPNNVAHYDRLEPGGHFAAWEQPPVFSQEMLDTFKPLR
jgi:pimeloyl-ACP methyl ester carboxylesterase